MYLTCELFVHLYEKLDSRVVVCLAPCCRGVRVDGLCNIWLGDVIVKVGTAPVNSVEDLVNYVETFEVRCSRTAVLRAQRLACGVLGPATCLHLLLAPADLLLEANLAIAPAPALLLQTRALPFLP